MNVETVTNPGYEQPTKKSNKALFACGGIGCLLLFLVCGLGIGGIVYISFGIVQAMEEAKVKVSENAAVKQALGEPLEFGPAPVQNTETNQAEGLIGFDQPVEGPDGEGTIKMLIKYVPPATFELQELRVEVDGQDEDIDVMEDDELTVEIEDVVDEIETDSEEESVDLGDASEEDEAE